MKRLISILLLTALAAGLFGCAGKPASDVPAVTDAPVVTEADPTAAPDDSPAPSEPEADAENEYLPMKLSDMEYGRDYVSLYEEFGGDVLLSEVTEDENGYAFIERDGKRYELGLDFLSKAMIRNTDPCAGYDTADDVYAGWWRLYMLRWNHLLPSVPIYSNDYYFVYNTRIGGVQEHPVNPYWHKTSALIYWTSAKEDNSITVGINWEFGMLRLPTYSVRTDMETAALVQGLELVSETSEGGYVWNPTVVKEHTETQNPDGSRTFTVTIFDDLRFSDGSSITAEDYLVRPMLSMTDVLAEAAGRNVAPVWDFLPQTDGAYGAVRLLGEHSFSLTVPKEQADDFYCLRYFRVTPEPHEAWLDGARITDSGEGCFITEEFFERNGSDEYAAADRLNKLLTDTSPEALAAHAWSGPYVPAELEEELTESYDDVTLILTKNPYFKGNYEGVIPGIERVELKQLVTDVMFEQLINGELDAIDDIVGPKAIEDYAIRLVEGSNGEFAQTHYYRAGFGQLAFRDDLGPVQFAAVRRAIAHCFDRELFVKDMLIYGRTVNAPMHESSWMYKRAGGDEMKLCEYEFSVEKAIAELEAGGWIYDKDGEPYESGVRYKCIPLDCMDEKDLNYSVLCEQYGSDGSVASSEEYKVNVVGDKCYMPLALNYFSPITELGEMTFHFLMDDTGGGFSKAGFAISCTFGDMATMLNEFYQQPIYQYYENTEITGKYNMFSYMEGYSEARFDMSGAITPDPENRVTDSRYFLRDAADVYMLP